MYVRQVPSPGRDLHRGISGLNCRGAYIGVSFHQCAAVQRGPACDHAGSGYRAMKPRQVTRKVASLLILREGKQDPHDSEWDETLQILASNRDQIDAIRVLVVSDGGGPTQAQRKRLQNTLDGKMIRVAVVSDSMKVRFICSSVALFTANLSSFRTFELASAFAWLGLTSQEQQVARRTIDQIHDLVE